MTLHIPPCVKLCVMIVTKNTSLIFFFFYKYLLTTKYVINQKINKKTTKASLQKNTYVYQNNLCKKHSISIFKYADRTIPAPLKRQLIY